MNTRLPWMAFALSTTFLVSACSGCKKDDAPPTTSSPVEEVPTAATPAQPEEPKVPPFANGDDLNTQVPANTEPLTYEGVSPKFVSGAWSTFRGNESRTGVRDVPAISRPQILWRTQVGIAGYANTIVEGEDLIWASSQGTTHDVSDEQDGVVAIRKADGQIVWRYRTSKDANGMTFADGVLYVVTDDQKLHAIDAQSGDAKWTQDLGCEQYTAPIVDGDFILVRRGANVERYFRENGNPETTQGSCQNGERAGISKDGSTVVASSFRERVRLYENNNRLWTSLKTENDLERYGDWLPSIILSQVVISQHSAWPYLTDRLDFRNRPLYSFRPAIVARWRNSGAVIWNYDVQGEDPDAASRATRPYSVGLPLVVGGKVYLTPPLRNEITVLDAVSGTSVGRIALPDCRTRQFASMVGTPTHGYLARHDGVLYQFSYADQRVTWSIGLGKAALSGTTRSHAGVPQGMCSSEPTNGTALFATPTIGSDGTVYVHSGEGWVYAIGEPN